MSTDIYKYVTEQTNAFETDTVKLGDNFNWSMRSHIQLIFHLKNGMFFTGENNWLRAFKNIMEPILNLSYWSEQIEVKDITFYIEEEEGHVLSFLIKKYHDEVYVRKYNLDTLFDEITESDLDYGGALVQMNTVDPKPETLELNTVAFCDQTDIEGGPVGFRVDFSPDKLRQMSKNGWGKPSNGATVTIDELITLAKQDKDLLGTKGMKTKTTGKNIEAYIVIGGLPEAYLLDNDNMDDWYGQVQVVAFYIDKDGNKQGVTLYRKKEAEGNLLFHTSKKVYGRALGRGVGEALLHPQIWTNFLTIHKTNFLEAASKNPLYTDDPAYTQKNKIQDMENNEITTIEDGKRIYQVPTAAPVNVRLFEDAISEWQTQAQSLGAAQDPLLGKNAPSGTAFQAQRQAVQQGQGIHNRRRGQRAKFIEHIYRHPKGIIARMVKEITNGTTFLATLSLEDMQWVTDNLVTCASNDMIKQMVLDGGLPTPDIQQQFQQLVRDELKKKGNKYLVEILKEDFKDIEIKVGIDVSGKEKDLYGMVEKLTSVFQTIMANPYILKSPPIGKLFNKIIEASGLQPIDLSQLDIPRVPAMRVTESVDFKDLPPSSQQAMLKTLGYEGEISNSDAPAPTKLGVTPP